MLRDKINAIISEVNSQLAEREELVYTIALALLTRKNLFVLGDPGQAKSQAIDSFRSHIRDARQFEILMSKGIDQEQLFGRLDLASIIPGHVSGSVLNDDEGYKQLSFELECVLRDAAGNTDCAQYFNSIQVKRERLEEYRKALSFCGTKSGRDYDKAKETGLTPLFTDGTTTFEEAKLTLVCRKLAFQDMSPDGFLDESIKDNYAQNDYHRIYVGEILKVYEKL